ncbi:endonuclease domain-containing protein [Caulobacter sp.]|uniref:endonuclease domain-containing protein n=1 Tax=Caulobacter sp. TaxID=78 RepID=UPI001B036F41|nr:endonuclease domain-containing protein [Caulobacter sp.]MBO9545742.1 endonuclease domain-containing protein [Caulobacter sp.]
MRSSSKTHTQAKTLRRALTPPEVILWARLRARQPDGPRIRRQHPIGPYIADFYCSAAKLVIEVDGWSHNMGDRPARDERRDAWMVEQGLTVVRYPADEVMRDPIGVADGIWDACVARMRSRR